LKSLREFKMLQLLKDIRFYFFGLRWWEDEDLDVYMPAYLICKTVGHSDERMWFNGEYCVRCGMFDCY